MVERVRDSSYQIFYLFQLHLTSFLFFVFDQQSHSPNVEEGLLFSNMHNSVKFFLCYLFLLIVYEIMQQFLLHELLLS